ncbi:MAG: histidine--tRNA ligase [Bacteroidales bacterium]|nr:histidine--tRNA ligase [Bacteroidales bacterium]
MSKQTIGIPRGTRDFMPHEMICRNYIFDIIRSTFEQFGYLPIETPSMENLSTLMGKYGEEGDRLVFKVLNSGDFTPDINLNESPAKIASRICEKGLRYDLTVPFARFVVQHQSDLTFPFKRYQMQPVWRADRPQKGRYREFYQCDADIIGSNSLLNEVELIHMIDTVFHKLNMEICILFNNRKILSGIAQYIGYEDKVVDITVAIDKMEKIGLEKVCEELKEKGIDETAIQKLTPILLLSGNNYEKINTLKEILKDSDAGIKGIEECLTVLSYIEDKNLSPQCEVKLDLTLARGLNYYTGTIFEVKSKQVPIGSITGGGRYDNLTGIFGLDNMSGVGISFGVERIYDVWKELNQNQEVQSPVKIFFVNFGAQEERYCLHALNTLRKNGIGAEIYPEAVKLQKQIKYADNKHIPFVVLAGENEINQQKFTVKDMQAHTQMLLSLEELLNLVNK